MRFSRRPRRRRPRSARVRADAAGGGIQPLRHRLEVAPPWLAPVLGDGEDPGLTALRRAASTVDEPLENPDESAVLVLLGGDPAAPERPDDALVVLTHRAPTLRRHAGQMSFPGGRRDPGDRDAVHTALREAEEETGLRPDAVTPLKVLDPIDISRTGFAVHPVLAYWHEPHDLRAMDPNETAEVLPVRISDLVDPANRIRVGWESWNGPAFRVGDFVVWGFTGGVLDHLLEGAGWAKPWDDGTVLDLRETLAKSANRETFGMDGTRR
ncbi:NUDIX domain-containing protein [Corynebacterium xerosis]|uniref:NUDIX domain-containing protein n=1 Tax=Corynebacterium xerosis TaxID=1725 RepID=A0A6B8TXL0_9CORY|nr:NUDIX domain-containing protein [Corynebacterium xerosis]